MRLTKTIITKDKSNIVPTSADTGNMTKEGAAALYKSKWFAKNAESLTSESGATVLLAVRNAILFGTGGV